jgi:small nuclear ribonucleoprotein (snRNP)-like protein
MNRLTVFMALVISSLTGCISTHRVAINNADNWIPEAQEQLLQEDVTLRTTDGQQYSGELEMFSTEKAVILDNEMETSVEEELTDVSYVGRSPNYVTPVLAGLGGVILGAIVGGGIGAGTTDPQPEVLGLNSVAATASAATVGAAVGGLVGILVGSLASTVDQYEIGRPSGSNGAEESGSRITPERGFIAKNK